MMLSMILLGSHYNYICSLNGEVQINGKKIITEVCI